MSELAENIRLYGGSQVLEMVQSLDSPVWKVQQVWFNVHFSVFVSFLTSCLPILCTVNVMLVLMRQTRSFKFS